MELQFQLQNEKTCLLMLMGPGLTWTSLLIIIRNDGIQIGIIKTMLRKFRIKLRIGR